MKKSSDFSAEKMPMIMAAKGFLTFDCASKDGVRYTELGYDIIARALF